jgi:hypothetical protein
MCSTTAAQLARICRAIEELAGQPGQPGRPGDVGGAGDTAGGKRGDAVADPVGEAPAGHVLAARLAAIWAMVAEADPELAKRVPGYLDAAE